MLWWTQRLDMPTDTFNIDKALDPEFKEFYCKRMNPQLLSTFYHYLTQTLIFE